MRYEAEPAGVAELLALHRHKTGALIRAAAAMGCAAAQAPQPVRQAMDRYAAELGLVFQIVDDILDVTATTEELGKPAGSDASNEKTTFVTLYGLEGAQKLARQHNEEALAALNGLGEKAEFLREMPGTAGTKEIRRQGVSCRKAVVTTMNLLMQALSWNYVLVTALISSLSYQNDIDDDLDHLGGKRTYQGCDQHIVPAQRLHQQIHCGNHSLRQETPCRLISFVPAVPGPFPAKIPLFRPGRSARPALPRCAGGPASAPPPARTG